MRPGSATAKNLFVMGMAVLAIGWIGLAAAGALPHNEEALSRVQSENPQQTGFSFVVMGDSRDGNKVFEQIIAQVNRDPSVHFVVDNGDLVPHGYKREFERYLREIRQLKAPLLTVIGNHEVPVGGSDVNYRTYMGQPYYAFAFGNSYFIVTDDANETGLGQNQQAWLAEQLKKSQDYTYRFVFMHVPLYDPRKGAYAKGHSLQSDKNAKILNDLFDRYSVSMLFTSHIHSYYRGLWQRTPFIVTGGAGAPLQDGGFYHYIKVSVGPDRVKYQVIRAQ